MCLTAKSSWSSHGSYRSRPGYILRHCKNAMVCLLWQHLRNSLRTASFTSSDIYSTFTSISRVCLSFIRLFFWYRSAASFFQRMLNASILAACIFLLRTKRPWMNCMRTANSRCFLSMVQLTARNHSSVFMATVRSGTDDTHAANASESLIYVLNISLTEPPHLRFLLLQ